MINFPSVGHPRVDRRAADAPAARRERVPGGPTPGTEVGAVAPPQASAGRLRARLDRVGQWARDDVAQRAARCAPKAADLLGYVTSEAYRPGAPFYKGGTLFHAIARSPDATGDAIAEILRAACRKGFDIRASRDALSNVPPGERRKGAAETALHTALRKRQLHALQTLLHYDADPNLRDEGGVTAIVVAQRQEEAARQGLELALGRDEPDAVCARHAARLARVGGILALMRGTEARLAAARER